MWDLGGVLVSVDHDKISRLLSLASEKNLEELSTVIFGASPAGIDHREGLVKLFNTGHIDGLEFYHRLQTAIGLRMSYGEFVHAWTDIFAVHKKTFDYLVRLQEMNVPQAIVSSTNPLHLEKIVELTHLDKLIGKHHFVTTYDVGVEKPDRKLYDAASACLGVPLQRCAYVDDIKDYVDAAVRYGIGVGIHVDLSLPYHQERCLAALNTSLFAEHLRSDVQFQ
ncbi:MAG: HAD family hydrolase [Nanoarchaeota archaeon]